LRDSFAASGKWFRVRCNIAFLEGAGATLNKSPGPCPARHAMSALSRIATIELTRQEGRFVPTADNFRGMLDTERKRKEQTFRVGRAKSYRGSAGIWTAVERLIDTIFG
jgi:hypothetical protein